MSEDIVKKTNAVFAFKIKGNEKITNIDFFYKKLPVSQTFEGNPTFLKDGLAFKSLRRCRQHIQ